MFTPRATCIAINAFPPFLPTSLIFCVAVQFFYLLGFFLFFFAGLARDRLVPACFWLGGHLGSRFVRSCLRLRVSSLESLMKPECHQPPAANPDGAVYTLCTYILNRSLYFCGMAFIFLQWWLLFILMCIAVFLQYLYRTKMIIFAYNFSISVHSRNILSLSPFTFHLQINTCANILHFLYRH